MKYTIIAVGLFTSVYCLYLVFSLPYSSALFGVAGAGIIAGFLAAGLVLQVIIDRQINDDELEFFEGRENNSKFDPVCSWCECHPPIEKYHPYCSFTCSTAQGYLGKNQEKN